MPSTKTNASRHGELTTLQNAVNTATNGSSLDVTAAVGALVQITGVFTNITANFEASADSGASWFAVALRPLAGGASAATATATGLYILDTVGGLSDFRVRTTIGAVTGTMTVKAAPLYVLR